MSLSARSPGVRRDAEPDRRHGCILIDNELMRKALLSVAEDPGLDALVLATDLPKIAPPDPAPMIEMFRGTAEILRNSPKPIVVMGNTLTDITAFGRQVAAETGYPGVLGGIHHGLTALAAPSAGRRPTVRRARRPRGGGAAVP